MADRFYENFCTNLYREATVGFSLYFSHQGILIRFNDGKSVHNSAESSPAASDSESR